MTQDKFSNFCKEKLHENSDNFKLIFSGIVGSVLYGTDTDDSDIDIKGAFIPPKEYILGNLHKIEQLSPKNSDDDTVYYELRKFLRIALECNPTIIEMLFIPEEYQYVSTPDWKEIAYNRRYFISKRARHSFVGYAVSQLNRIKTHRNYLLSPPKEKPKRSDFGLSDYESNITHDLIGAFNKYIANFLEQVREFHPLKEQLLEMEETFNYNTIVQKKIDEDSDLVKKFMPHISEGLIEEVMREKRYRAALANWNKYLNWKKNRNKKRAELKEKFGYDTKHALHLMRLLYEGKELLENGFITLPRPEAKHLKEILNGKWSFDRLLQEVEDCDKYFDNLYETSNLPKEPNRKEVDNICINMIHRFIS